MKLKRTIVFLDDLLDDRKAEAGPPRAGRDVRLGQPVAEARGQTDAVVAHSDRHEFAPRCGFSRKSNLAPHAVLLVARDDRLGGILKEIGECLRKLSPVANERWKALIDI